MIRWQYISTKNNGILSSFFVMYYWPRDKRYSNQFFQYLLTCCQNVFLLETMIQKKYFLLVLLYLSFENSKTRSVATKFFWNLLMTYLADCFMFFLSFVMNCLCSIVPFKNWQNLSVTQTDVQQPLDLHRSIVGVYRILCLSIVICRIRLSCEHIFNNK